jgi:hypothetical protein
VVLLFFCRYIDIFGISQLGQLPRCRCPALQLIADSKTTNTKCRRRCRLGQHSAQPHRRGSSQTAKPYGKSTQFIGIHGHGCVNHNVALSWIYEQRFDWTGGLVDSHSSLPLLDDWLHAHHSLRSGIHSSQKNNCFRCHAKVPRYSFDCFDLMINN